MDYDKMMDETEKAFNDPRPGMRFSEMYSFWIYVLIVSPEGFITVRTFSGHPANPYRESNKIITYGSRAEFQKAYSYGSIKGYWVHYVDDLAFERMKKEVMVTAEDIERGYIEE